MSKLTVMRMSAATSIGTLAPLLLIVAITCKPVHADETMTVYQYYLKLPNRFFFDEDPNIRNRMNLLLDSKGSILDNQHDYLYAPGGDGQWAIEMAIFYYKGIATVAVSAGGYDPDIPTLDFLRYQNGKWVNVTKAVAPYNFIVNESADAYDNSQRTDSLNAWQLPQHGTTIMVTTKTYKTIKLYWINGRFRLHSPTGRAN